MQKNLNIIIMLCLIQSSNIAFASYNHHYVRLIQNAIPDRDTGELLGITPAHCLRTVEEAKDLMKYGPDLDAPDIKGTTPIQYMIINQRHDVALYLLTQNARISDSDKAILMQRIADRDNAVLMHTQAVSNYLKKGSDLSIHGRTKTIRQKNIGIDYQEHTAHHVPKKSKGCQIA